MEELVLIETIGRRNFYSVWNINGHLGKDRAAFNMLRREFGFENKMILKRQFRFFLVYVLVCTKNLFQEEGCALHYFQK